MRKGYFVKLDEEIGELRAEVAAADTEKMQSEFGDVMFTMMNLGRHLKIDAESALRGSNAKFRRRFAAMESMGVPLAEKSAEDLETLWAKVKAEERALCGPTSQNREVGHPVTAAEEED